MTIEEELRCKVNALISMVKFSEHLRAASEEMDMFFTIGNYEQKVFENPEEKKKFNTVKESFNSSVDAMKKIYGNDIVNECFDVFLKVVQNETLCQDVFGVPKLPEDLTEENLFQKAFNIVKQSSDIFSGNFDDYEFWKDTISQILNPIQKPEDAENKYICPYCGNLTEKYPSSYFLSAVNASVRSFVWGCPHCGAYAFAGSNGEMVGTIGDESLHKKRYSFKKMINEYCDLKGATFYECFSCFSKVIGVRIEKVSDIEKLNEEQCDRAISYFLKYKESKPWTKVKHPKSHKELMQMIKEGGRLKILTSLVNDEAGRLLIPIAAGDSAFMVRTDFSTEKVTLPKVLKYEFDGPIFTIIHPDKKERFKMYPVISKTGKKEKS